MGLYLFQGIFVWRQCHHSHWSLAVKAILGSLWLNNKHSRWWTNVYGSSMLPLKSIIAVGSGIPMLMLSLGTPSLLSQWKELQRCKSSYYHVYYRCHQWVQRSKCWGITQFSTSEILSVSDLRVEQLKESYTNILIAYCERSALPDLRLTYLMWSMVLYTLLIQRNGTADKQWYFRS